MARNGTLAAFVGSGRNRLVAGFFAVAVLVAVWPGARLGAQEATPAVADPMLAAWIADYNTAWSSGDPGQVGALYTDDAVFAELVLDGVVTTNRDELEAFAAAAAGAFDGLAITVTDAFASGDRVAAEWVLTGSYTGVFGSLPQGTGQAVEIPGASILQLEDGLIANQREYWDVAMLLSQVGALPGAES